MTVKICYKCQHCVSGLYKKCTNENCLDTGQSLADGYKLCDIARDKDGKCGLEGKFFEEEKEVSFWKFLMGDK